MSHSADPDARWLKKGRRCYLGYEAFVSTSEGQGFIQALHVEAAFFHGQSGLYGEDKSDRTAVSEEHVFQSEQRFKYGVCIKWLSGEE